MLNQSPNFCAKVLIFLIIQKTISKHFSTLTILTKKNTPPPYHNFTFLYCLSNTCLSSVVKKRDTLRCYQFSLTFTKRHKKKGKKTTSRRYNLLPLLRSRPGGLAGSWPCRTYPAAKVILFLFLTNFFEKIVLKRAIIELLTRR